ncbi:PAS domain-containing hybrid sensor histidine kinase/response regulator [Thiorhodococcus minor]|uniref:histidine kinase n=1 Tax=Thiorhodococcus minor TaxID=57489 RepID=A0A6M0K1G6_9GAMM|nr:PAS domain S-box protein [Thiorhodococcus minor]NEV63598.1 PAS domain S-box protein [Thiorhodococcus minor]
MDAGTDIDWQELVGTPALLRAFPDPLWIKDLSGIYRACNPAFERFFSIQDVLGRADHALFPASLAQDFERREQVLVSSGETQRYLQAVIASDGANVSYLDVSLSPLTDTRGRLAGILGTGRGIRADRCATEAAWYSESRFHQLFEQIEAISVQGYDRYRRVIYWNPASTVLYGYSAEEAIGCQLEDLIIPDAMRDAVIAGVDAWGEGGPAISAGELTLRRADGSPVHVFSSHVMLQGPDGEPQMYCVDIDLSARKAAEEQARKLSLAVEQSPVSILITDLEGRIEYVNEALIQSSGYQRDEVIGKSPRIFSSGLTPRRVYDQLWAALSRGEEWRGELVNRRKDGTLYTESALITPIRQPGGEVSHYVAVKADVTEAKRTAVELERYRSHLEELVEQRTAELSEARRQAEAASEAKSAFLANMSHEIRTPMNAILGLTYLLGRNLSSDADRAILGQIDDSASHLLGIINDILDVSKIEAGKLSLRERDFSLDVLLGQVDSMIRAQAAAKGLRFDCVSSGVPRALHGDDTRLRQALVNYLTNAVKFTSAGSVTLRLSILEETQDQILLRVEVEDTGIGIAEDDLARLFAPFTQVDHSTARPFMGTGLGLVITRRLAQLMGGDAGAESALGRGSLFWLTARLGKAAQDASVQGDRVPAGEDAEQCLAERYAGLRVLVAEDDLINRDVIRELLRIVGLEADFAGTGHEVIAMACASRYPLVLMDIQMPEMDGLEASRRLRGRADWRPCPILAMTANAFEEDRQRCREAGMDDHLSKPVDPQHFYATLLTWLERSDLAGSATHPVKRIPRPMPAARAQAVARAGSLIDRIATLPGVDAAGALTKLQGYESLYQSVLGKFASHHADDPARLREALAAGDRGGARRLAHTLKGLGGTLGFVELHGLMSEILHAIDEGRDLDDLGPRIAAAEAAHARLVDSIRSAEPA